MLQTLYIENIAVIEKCSIDFNGGLNVLTGETGAGKTSAALGILGLLPKRTGRVTSGEVLFEGADLLKLSEKEMSCLRATIFRVFSLFTGTCREHPGENC